MSLNMKMNSSVFEKTRNILICLINIQVRNFRKNSCFSKKKIHKNT